MAITKAGAGKDSIHVVNSRAAVVSTTAGTIATQGIGVYVENAGAVINGLTINGDPAGEEGIKVALTDTDPVDVTITGNTIGVGSAVNAAFDELFVNAASGPSAIPLATGARPRMVGNVNGTSIHE